MGWGCCHSIGIGRAVYGLELGDSGIQFHILDQALAGSDVCGTGNTRGTAWVSKGWAIMD